MPPTTAKRRSKKTGSKKPKATPAPEAPAVEQSPLDQYLSETFENFRSGKHKGLNPTELMLCRKIEEAEKAQVAHNEALSKLQNDINRMQNEFATRQNLRDRAQATAQAHIDTLRGMFEMGPDNVVPFDGEGDESDDDDDAE